LSSSWYQKARASSSKVIQELALATADTTDAAGSIADDDAYSILKEGYFSGLI